MLFKFVIMILLYELVMIISTPAIKLVTTVPIEYVIFLLFSIFLSSGNWGD